MIVRLVTVVPAAELDAVTPSAVLVETDAMPSAVIAPPRRVTRVTVEVVAAVAWVGVDASVLVSVTTPVVKTTPAVPAEMLAAVMVPPGGRTLSATFGRAIRGAASACAP